MWPDWSLFFFKEGFLFRVIVGLTREIALSKTIVLPDGKVKLVETEESVALERSLIAEPRLTNLLHG